MNTHCGILGAPARHNWRGLGAGALLTYQLFFEGTTGKSRDHTHYRPLRGFWEDPVVMVDGL